MILVGGGGGGGGGRCPCDTLSAHPLMMRWSLNGNSKMQSVGPNI